MGNYNDLFRHLDQVEPSPQLYNLIFARINSEQRRIARTKLVFFGFGIFSSVIAFVPVFQYTAQEFSQSGFYQLVTLLFSDSGVVVFMWREFLLSLAESMPVLGIGMLLFVILIFMGSVVSLMKNTRIFFMPTYIARN